MFNVVIVYDKLGGWGSMVRINSLLGREIGEIGKIGQIY